MSVKPDRNMEQTILDAAELLFLEKGFALTSTTEIARVAGCNQALVHYYYRTKDKLFNAVFEKKARMFIDGLFQVDRSEATFEERLKRKIEVHFDLIRANPRMPFLIFNELITNPARLSALKEQLQDLPFRTFTLLKAELEAEIAKGKIRQMSVYDLLITLVSLNVMLFLANPIVKTLTNFSDEKFEEFIDHRRQEHVTIILNSLR